MSKVPKKISLNIFAISLEKSVATSFVFYCDSKHQIFCGGPVMFVVTSFISLSTGINTVP